MYANAPPWLRKERYSIEIAYLAWVRGSYAVGHSSEVIDNLNSLNTNTRAYFWDEKNYKEGLRGVSVI